MNRSKLTHTGLVALFLGLLLTVPIGVRAQSDAEMEAWVLAMKPGEPHADLARMAGEWRYVVTIWNSPGQDPVSLEGVSTKTSVMGGRFLKEELTGEYMNHPFQGFGITGYDNVTRRYVSIWFDNMGTGIHVYKGEEDGEGVRTYRSTAHDPATGKAIATRSVSRVIDHDHHTFESYVILPDGKEFLQMRVEYTRATA